MPCAVLIQSILYFNKFPITFHVVSADLSDDSKQKLQETVSQNQESVIRFYNFTKIVSDKHYIIRPTDRLSIETYFRIFLPELLPTDIHTVLYLDVDIICTGSLQELFSTDITTHAMGMVPDPIYSDIRNFNRLNYPMDKGYYNAGVILFNLDYWRQKQLVHVVSSYIETYSELCRYHDQDAINAVCHQYIFSLPIQYNTGAVFFHVYAWQDRKKYPYPAYNTDFILKAKWPDILTTVKKPLLVHFSGPTKPWTKECVIPFVSVWRYFLLQTTPYKSYKIRSQYTSKIKLLRLAIHFLLAKLHLMPPIPQTKFPQEAYQTEQMFLNKLHSLST